MNAHIEEAAARGELVLANSVSLLSLRPTEPDLVLDRYAVKTRF